MSQSSGKNEAVPFFQRMFDNPIVLLLIGLATMFILYTAWGMVEILTLPTATLP